MKNKLLSILITVAMIGATMLPIGLASPANAADVTETATWTKLSGSTAGQTIGTNGMTTYYYLNGNVSCTNTNAGGSGLSIAAGAKVYIYVPYGITLTCTGHASSGKTGGGAGILLPSNSTLYLVGSGTVKATGGNASMGANGENGVSSVYSSWDAISTSGAGGNGGGGAGAGIGTAGGTGGTGGSRQVRTQHIADVTEYTGTNGNNGTSGASALDAGTLYVSGVDISDVKGGQAATKNTSTVNYSGTARQWYNYSGNQTQWRGEQYYYIGGAGGGGNGGSGCSGNNIGPGGAGGGGAGSGGTGGMSFSMVSSGNYYYIYGGHGGQGGNTYSSTNYNLFDAGKSGKTDVKGGDYSARGGVGGNGYGSGATKSAKSANTTTNPSFTVKYNNLDGTTTNASYVVNNDSKITLKDCPGCKWRMDKYGKSCGNNSTLCTNTSELFEGNTTLDAINVYGNLEFTAVPNEYIVTLDTKGGSMGDSSIAVTYGGAIPTIEIPTNDNYIFNGFWNEDSGERIFDSLGNSTHEKFDFTENIELTACWEQTKEVQDKTEVNENLTGNEKTKAEQLKTTLGVNVGKADGKRHLKDYFFEREDILSHDLYFKNTIIAASDTMFSLDIKPMDKVSEHGQQIEEKEFEVDEGKEIQISMTAPDTMKQSASNNKIYIRHIKEDGTIYYDNTLIKKGTIRFQQTHGFSQFDISTEPFDDPEFAGKSLLLGSELGVNFYMDLPDGYEQGTMTFTISGKGTCTSEDAGVFDERNGRYKYTCKINSLQMADTITATFTSGNFKKAEKYRVLDYFEQAKVEGSDRMKTLAAKLYNYGYYAQNYLSLINEFELGDGDDQYAKMAEPGVTPSSSPDLSKYTKEVSANGNTEITDTSLALILDSTVGLNVYMTLSDDATYSEENKPSVAVDGEVLDESKIDFVSDESGNSMMLIKLESIPTSLLGHTYEIVVDGTYTVKASALSYAEALKQSEDDFAPQLAVAIYEYYLSTMNYAGKEVE